MIFNTWFNNIVFFFYCIIYIMLEANDQTSYFKRSGHRRLLTFATLFKAAYGWCLWEPCWYTLWRTPYNNAKKILQEGDFHSLQLRERNERHTSRSCNARHQLCGNGLDSFVTPLWKVSLSIPYYKGGRTYTES